MADYEPKLKIDDDDPYCIWEEESGEIIAMVTSDPDIRGKDPRAEFFARLFVLAHDMFVELETVVQSRKMGVLAYWNPKKAKKMCDQIRGLIG